MVKGEGGRKEEKAERRERRVVICYLDERGGRKGGRLFNELIIARCLELRW